MIQIIIALKRIFIGNMCFVDILEILFRTTFLFIYSLLNLRLISGKKSIGETTIFGFIIVIALGSAMGDPMFYLNIPLIKSMVVITTILVLDYLASYIAIKMPILQSIILAKGVLIIKDGKILTKNLRKQNISKDEIFERLRLHGIEYVGQVKYGILENSGKISFITYPNYKTISQGQTTLDDFIEQN